MICSVIQIKDASYLSKAMVKLLKELKINDPKIINKKLERLCNLIATDMHSELSILMLGLNNKEVSFR